MFEYAEMLKRIKDKKKEKHLTNAALSEITSIPLGTLNKILSGDSKDPQISAIIKIAHALDTSADYLVSGKEVISSANDIGINLYLKLDEFDRAEIRGEIKQMLKSEKYNTQNSISDDIAAELSADVRKNALDIK